METEGKAALPALRFHLLHWR